MANNRRKVSQDSFDTVRFATMRSARFLLLLAAVFFELVTDSQQVYECDFDYNEECLPGLPSTSYLLVNDTSQSPRQPASDVSAIGSCLRPFVLSLADVLSSF